MAKTEQVFARVEPELKARSESVLKQLGVSMSDAVVMFLNQVVLQNGIPFDLKLPVRKPIAFGALTDEQINEVLERGWNDYQNGNVLTVEESRAQVLKGLGL